LGFAPLVSAPSQAAAIITIDDRGDGIPELQVIGVPLGVPGIQNVIGGNEFISFTYDDLVPAATTRTRQRFLREIVRQNDLEVGTPSGISDAFIWSVVEGNSVETVRFFSNGADNFPALPNPCIPNLNFFQNSCEIFDELGDLPSDFFIVPNTGTTYFIQSDTGFSLISVPEPSSFALFVFAVSGLLGCGWRFLKCG
jgi:hypothetical protein